MRNLIWAVPALLLGMQICASADTILPGTQIVVRSDRSIDVHTWDQGRIYPAHVAQDVFARDGRLVIPRGSYAELVVRETGPNQTTLDLESVTVNGARYVMDTTGPPESAITFQLEQPLHVAGWHDPGYDRDGDWYR